MCKQTIKAHDRGFRGDAGTSSKHPGQDEKGIFPQFRVLVAKSANHLLFKGSSCTFLLDKSPAIKMEGSNVTTPGQNVTSGQVTYRVFSQ